MEGIMANIEFFKDFLPEDLFQQVETALADVDDIGVVPKSEVEPLTQELETLKAKTSEFEPITQELETLKAQVGEYESIKSEYETLKQTHTEYKKQTLIQNAFVKNGITSEKVQRSILANMDTSQFSFEEDTLAGFDEQFTALKEDEHLAGLFGAKLIDTPPATPPQGAKKTSKIDKLFSGRYGF